jgi:uncharacterized protein (TIGR00369 family)
VRASFARLTLMQTIEARLLRVIPGAVEIQLPFQNDLAQQHGFHAAGLVTALVDTACSYAAMRLMPAGVGVLTVEYKVNFPSPARGHQMIARGHVMKPGRTLMVCAGDVVAVAAAEEKAAATMLTTMIVINDGAVFAGLAFGLRWMSGDIVGDRQYSTGVRL